MLPPSNTTQTHTSHTGRENFFPFITLKRLAEVLVAELGVHILSVVDVEKVRVENCLDDASQDWNTMEMMLRKVAIYPIWNVECSVQP
jgi:hypothetical protein